LISMNDLWRDGSDWQSCSLNSKEDLLFHLSLLCFWFSHDIYGFALWLNHGNPICEDETIISAFLRI
jgi:hypothetical protein